MAARSLPAPFREVWWRQLHANGIYANIRDTLWNNDKHIVNINQQHCGYYKVFYTVCMYVLCFYATSGKVDLSTAVTSQTCEEFIELWLFTSLGCRNFLASSWSYEDIFIPMIQHGQKCHMTVHDYTILKDFLFQPMKYQIWIMFFLKFLIKYISKT